SRLASGRYCSTLRGPVIQCLHNDWVEHPRVFLQGMKRCVTSCDPLLKVTDVQTITEAINRLYQRAQKSGPCRAAIGGPIDVAVIDSCGRKWLQSKRAFGPLI